MEIVLTVVYSLVFFVLINKLEFYKLPGINTKIPGGIFLLKVLAGTALYLIYTHYYTDRRTADIFKYFDDSLYMFNALTHKPLDFLSMLSGIGNNAPRFHEYYDQMNNWYSKLPGHIYGDGHIMIRFNALIRIFSFGFYNVHTVFICFLSFTGLIGLYRFLSASLPGKGHSLLLAVFLVPSVVFWGSGVLKEGLIVFAIGMLLFNTRQFAESGFSWKKAVWILSMLLTLRFTKLYLFIIFVPLLISWYWSFKNTSRTLLKYLVVNAFSFTAVYLIKFINPEYDFIDILICKQKEFIRLAGDAGSSSLMFLPAISHGILPLIKASAFGFFQTFCRPFPWEIHNMFMLMACTENVITLALIIYVLFNFNKPRVDKSMLWFSLILVLFVFSLAGIICPISGALVRYKVPALPFLFACLILLYDKKQIYA